MGFLLWFGVRVFLGIRDFRVWRQGSDWRCKRLLSVSGSAVGHGGLETGFSGSASSFGRRRRLMSEFVLGFSVEVQLGVLDRIRGGFVLGNGLG